MKRRLFPACIILCLFCSQAVIGQDAQADRPAWIILEEGKKAYEERDFGGAFRLFRAALERSRPYPEAHMWMAVIYEEEGEYDLAERHYLEALSREKDFYILEDAFVARYRLAALYEQSRQYGAYESTLRDILRQDVLSVQDIALRNAMVRNIREKGLDKLVELYRLDVPKFMRAYGLLGIFYYRTGRYAESIEHLTVAILDVLSRLIAAEEERDPLYTFETTNRLLQESMKHEGRIEFLENSDFFRELYYLAGALFAVGEVDHARTIWNLVTSYGIQSEWTRRAAEQLRSPFIEPIMSLDG